MIYLVRYYSDPIDAPNEQEALRIARVQAGLTANTIVAMDIAPAEEPRGKRTWSPVACYADGSPA